jgi:hypothetical protein
MSKTLKQQNQVALVLFVVANACAITVLLAGWDSFNAFLSEALKGNWAIIGRTLGLPAIAGLLVGIISWVLPRRFKEMLVFWRDGERCMPSSRAFSKIAASDPRIDSAQLKVRVGEFPQSPAEQSARWYAIYRTHAKEPAVDDANRAYLLYREMTALVPIMLLTLLVVGLIAQSASRLNWAIAVGVLVFEFVLVALAGRNAGSRLVANVLAIEASTTKKTPREPSTASKARKKST